MPEYIIRSAPPESPEMLEIISYDQCQAHEIVELLRQDRVVMIKNLTPDRADTLVSELADLLGLTESLELQAGFAALYGHRKRIGKNLMTVNERSNYEFITPHCEGDGISNIQFASFYCYGNSTDGGETILMKIDEASPDLPILRELSTRIAPGSKQLSIQQAALAKALYRLRSPDDYLRAGDRILGQRKTEIPGLVLLTVLALPEKAYSRLLDKSLHPYWDTIASIDHSSAESFTHLLRQNGLLKSGDALQVTKKMDHTAKRRIWRSGVNHAALFSAKMTLKLSAGDFIAYNNLTWAHGVANWTPGCGIRRLAAAFA